jgi:hypothetical protein
MEKDGQEIKNNVRSLNGNFGLYYQHLYNTITTGAPLREQPEHGFNTIKLIELALQSSSEKRTLACEDLMEADYPKD